MMFKWPDGRPSPKADAHELADFVELVTWRDGRMSAVELMKHINRIDETDYTDGVPEEDELSPLVEAVFEELERRSDACAGCYPFHVGNHGQTARFDAGRCRRASPAIYMYLLLATRLNMNIHRMYNEIDGTALFEELAAQCARTYLGRRSRGLVFGTAVKGSFAAKVDSLCKCIGEGDGFKNHVGGRLAPKDAKLDVVAWIPFSDGGPSKLIIFGQCKTGTHYRDHLTQLQPDSFFADWCLSTPMVTPTRAFFVAEALSRLRRRGMARDAGILFDRCRIVDFSDAAGQDVLDKIASWTDAAAAAAGLPMHTG